MSFKNNIPFISIITKINNTLSGNAEDLDMVMPMYNLIEYSQNYSTITGCLWNYYRDKPNSGAVRDINYFIKLSKSFDDKASITAKTRS